MQLGMFPLLFGLVCVAAVGALLRRTHNLGAPAAHVLSTIILNVTVPALLLMVLQRKPPNIFSLAGTAATTVGIVAASAFAVFAVRARGGSRPAQATAALTGAFANTGFLGFPLLSALYGADDDAGGTAFVIDFLDTTLLMWTAGMVVAGRLAGAPPLPMGQHLRDLLRRPFAWAVLLGLLLGTLGVQLPALVQRPVEMLAGCTSPLVFLYLGMSLELKGLRGRGLAVASTVFAKLVVAPTVALLACLVLAPLHAPVVVWHVAVLQSAMPTALVSVVVARECGGDEALASAVAAVSTLAALITVPVWAWVLVQLLV